MTKATGIKKVRTIIKRKALRDKLDNIRCRLGVVIEELHDLVLGARHKGRGLGDADVLVALAGSRRIRALIHEDEVDDCEFSLTAIRDDVDDAVARLDAEIAALKVGGAWPRRLAGSRPRGQNSRP